MNKIITINFKYYFIIYLSHLIIIILTDQILKFIIQFSNLFY